MVNSLQSEPVRDLLDRLFQAAEGDDLRRVRVDRRHPDGFGPTSAREQADAYLFPESDGLEITCRV